MEINPSAWLQLGLGGAALLILFVFVILLFQLVRKTNNDSNTQQISKIDKLCDKIDSLISSNAEHTGKLNEVLLSNDKDQKENIRILENILTIASDTQRRVVRIDDRTFKCLGNETSKGDDFNV